MADKTLADWQTNAAEIQIDGRDKSMHAFDDYTELKTTWIEFE
jgi:hypothetical protein